MGILLPILAASAQMLETLHYEYIDNRPKLGRRHGDGADTFYLFAATAPWLQH